MEKFILALVEQRSYNGPAGTTIPNVANLLAVRFLANGLLDPQFGTGGIVNLTALNSEVDVNEGYVSVENDGKLVFCSLGQVFRTDAMGNLDVSFAGAYHPLFWDVISLPDQSVLLLGKNSGSMAVKKLNSDGSVNTSFGTNGIYTLNIPPDGENSSTVNGYVIQPDGKLLLIGSYDSDYSAAPVIVARLNADYQSMDNTFGSNGVATFTLDGGIFYPEAVAVNAVGSVFVGGGEGLNLVTQFLIKLTSTGSLDTSFGSGTNPGGFLLGSPGDITFINPLASGGLQVIADQQSYGETPAGVMQLTSTGSIDTTFGAQGFVNPANLMAVLGATYPNGDLVLAGRIPNGGFLFFMGLVSP